MMKKVVILGSNGMAGHIISQYFNSFPEKYNLKCLSRKEIDINSDLPDLIKLIEEINPNIIINCIGVLIKASQENPAQAIFINSLFPHILEALTKDTETKIIHLSTDCIFKGDVAGKYSENDLPTETNWYGRSKALGELNNNKDLTLRMSIIGPQLNNNMSLFHWVTTTKEEILQGFDSVFWNGITTLELAKQIDQLIDINLTGVYHLVSNNSITKGDLIRLINEIFNCKKIVKSNKEIYQNKILANNRIKEYNPNIPDYRIQLEELKAWCENGYKI